MAYGFAISNSSLLADPQKGFSYHSLRWDQSLPGLLPDLRQRVPITSEPSFDNNGKSMLSKNRLRKGVAPDEDYLP